MKKYMLSLVMLLLVITLVFGCSAIQVSTNSTPATDTTTVSKAYKHGKAVGEAFAIYKPDLVDVTLPYAKELLASAKAGAITDDQIEKAVDMLAEKLNADQTAKIALAMAKAEVDIKVTVGTVNSNIVDFLGGFVEAVSKYSSKTASLFDWKYLTSLDHVPLM